MTPWGIFNHHNLFVRSLEWKLASIVFMCGCSVSILVLVGLIWRNLILLFVLVNICAGRSYLKKSNVRVRVTFGCSLWCTSIIRMWLVFILFLELWLVPTLLSWCIEHLKYDILTRQEIASVLIQSYFSGKRVESFCQDGFLMPTKDWMTTIFNDS